MHNNVTSLSPAYLPLVDPILEYDRRTGQTVTGGYVYRGLDLGPAYRGRDFFADFVQGRVWSFALVLHPITQEGRALALKEHTRELGGDAIGNISSFGLDADGELYIVSYSTGRILKVLRSTVRTTIPLPSANPRRR